MQLVIPSGFILPNEKLYLTAQDELENIMQDKEIWQWWSGGDGKYNFSDRIFPDKQEQNYFYADEDKKILLWIGEKGDVLNIQTCILPPNNRRYGALVIDYIVQLLWSYNWRKIETQAALNETNLLVAYHRSYFLSNEDFVINNKTISDQIATLIRYSPEVIY